MPQDIEHENFKDQFAYDMLKDATAAEIKRGDILICVRLKNGKPELKTGQIVVTARDNYMGVKETTLARVEDSDKGIRLTSLMDDADPDDDLGTPIARVTARQRLYA